MYWLFCVEFVFGLDTIIITYVDELVSYKRLLNLIIY